MTFYAAGRRLTLRKPRQYTAGRDPAPAPGPEHPMHEPKETPPVPGTAGQIASDVRAYLTAFSRVLDSVDETQLADVGQLLWQAWEDDHTIHIIGNGGSASTATHMACDLTKQTHTAGRRALRAQSLLDNTALVSAYANDIDYGEIFSEQLRVQARPGDVLVCISCSGTSKNVVSGVRTAKALGLTTIAFGGCDGGEMIKLCDSYVHVESFDFGLIESAHILFEHCLTHLLHGRARAQQLELIEPSRSRP